MACFLVSAAEALVVTAAEKGAEAREEQGRELALRASEVPAIPFSRKLKWLKAMLWGGAALLAFEHIWHGEVVPWFPFLTAMSNAADTAAMLQEMATVGVCMALSVTGVWAAMCWVADRVLRRMPEAERVTA